MNARDHHYVPRFYLRRFKSQSRRINIHNISSNLTRRDASIKHECSKSDYYRTAQIEDALAELEGRASHAISALCEGKHVAEMEIIRQFIAVQHQRTPSSAQRAATFHSKVHKRLGGDAVDIEMDQRVRFDTVSPKNFPVFNLLMIDVLTEALADLKLVVVQDTSDVFITSDNPVFKYNQYLEDIRNRGTTGLGQTGIQIFFPLSPKHILVLYDANVYEYVKKQRPTATDVTSLNGLQVISANRNLYFSDWMQATTVENLASQYSPLRPQTSVVLDEFSSDEHPSHSLVVGYEQSPNVRLDLSFLRVKKRAARIGMARRLREALRPKYRHPVVRSAGPTETFSARVARY